MCPMMHHSHHDNPVWTMSLFANHFWMRGLVVSPASSKVRMPASKYLNTYSVVAFHHGREVPGQPGYTGSEVLAVCSVLGVSKSLHPPLPAPNLEWCGSHEPQDLLMAAGGRQGCHLLRPGGIDPGLQGCSVWALLLSPLQISWAHYLLMY